MVIMVDYLLPHRALRLLRLSLLAGNVPQMRASPGALLAGAVNVPLLWLVASVVSWMFTSASLVHLMEKIPWHDALYFVTTTLTTVGYGDVVVKSNMGEGGGGAVKGADHAEGGGTVRGNIMLKEEEGGGGGGGSC